MYFEQPQYADGIGKGKQTRFGGLNHNEGAGDGELFEMRNLCSDYYPLIATRKKRRKLRTLAKPNGLYAWEKLCWVDGTTFYYDGVAKGTVADGRKQFAAINDIIIIMPDKKYYDAAEDRFGDLEAEVGACAAGQQITINTRPRLDVTFSVPPETLYTWTNRLPQDSDQAILNVGNSITIENDRISIDATKVYLFRNYIGQMVYLYNMGDPYNGGAKKLTAINATEGWLQFESGSFRDGTYGPGRVANFIAFYPCDIRTVTLSARAIDGTGERVSVGTAYVDEFLNFFTAGDIVDIAFGEESAEKQIIRERQAAELYLTESPFESQTVTELFTMTGRRVQPVEFRNGNTIYCEAINWSGNIVKEGGTIKIVDSGVTVEHTELDENDEEITVTETVSNDGVYIVRAVNGHEIVCDDGSFTDGTDTSSKDYYLGGTGIHFYTSLPSAAIFSDGSDYSSIYARLTNSQEAYGGYTGYPAWNQALETGNYVRIEGCGTEENNRELVVRTALEREVMFDAGSFSECVDEDGITVTRLHEHPIVFQDGTLYGEPAEANTIYCNAIVWSDYFRVGDTITITGCTIPLNNQTIIIRELDGHEMRFYERSFTNGVDTGTEILFRRNIPSLECVFENDNRLWGYAEKAIYASKLGDPFNFNVYDGLDTDSYAVDTGSAGNFTGACSYMGYPTFFKDQDVYKVYGSKPSNYEVMNVATLGLMSGSGKSLAIAGETLFYLGNCGVIMYTGGIPTPINRAFGQERYRNAVAGSDGLKYYISMEDEEGEWHLFVYDSQKGMWHEEDQKEIVGFAYLEGQLYMLDSDGNMTTEGYAGVEGEEEEDFEWYAEFTDFTDDSPNKKEVHKIQIRLDLEEDAWCRLKLQMDGDGEWFVPAGGRIEGGSKMSYTLAIVPRRADFYKLRLEGQGGCKIYSIARQYVEASELKSRPGRQ